MLGTRVVSGSVGLGGVPSTNVSDYSHAIGLSSTAIGTWDAEVPRRLVGYRQQEGISESALITMLSATPTIIGLTALAAAVFRWRFGRWRESLVVIYAVVGETSIFTTTTLFIDRPRPLVPHLDVAPPTVIPLWPYRCRRVLLRLGCRDCPLAQPAPVGQRGRRRHLRHAAVDADSLQE
jgi:hypothetical protein